MRFGAKKVNFQICPISATIPSVTEIAKMAMTIGVTPAMSAPNTTINTMIAATIADRLAEAQVLLGDLLEVLGRRGLAQDERLNAAGARLFADRPDLVDVLGRVVDVAGHDHREQDRPSVLGGDRSQGAVSGS